MSRLSALVAVSSFCTLARAYVWPNTHLDALEDARWNQFGAFSSGAISPLTPCNSFVRNDSGRSNAADWIRTAYHDMATFDATTGKGGLDASIRFAEEQARAENVGDAFANTMSFLSENRFVGPEISIADSLVIGALLAIENCGGPQIPFRGGRIDATEPNDPGVPLPQQDLDTHVAVFKRFGFTQDEMIGLVACGHTFGGVQHAQFPDIVPDLNNPADPESNAPFDSTFVTFDNNIAVEYIHGTTLDPLVVGANDTFNSDKRIFGSDGNKTMSAFANSPELFAGTCATLFAKMFDTVPTEVTLTDVIEPLPVKPYQVFLQFMGDGTIQFSGEVRIFNRTEDSVKAVELHWKDRNGVDNSSPLSHSSFMVGGALGGRVTSLYYGWDTTPITLDEHTGISLASFAVTNSDDSTTTFDQDGLGFEFQDKAMWSVSSCFKSITTGEAVYDIAIRRDISASVDRLYLQFVKSNGSNAPGTNVQVDIPRPNNPTQTDSVYEIWSIDTAGTPLLAQTGVTLGAVIDGKLYEVLSPITFFLLPRCA